VLSSIKISQFSEFFSELNLFFEIIFLKDSYFIWIGVNPPELENIAFAINTPFDTISSSTYLLGANLDGASKKIAVYLGKKTGKPVYVSFNVKEGDSKAISSFAVKRLLQELENKS